MTQHSVLGALKTRIPTSGHIRPGIKVLVKKYADNQQLQKLYSDMLAKGHNFSEIEAAIYHKFKLQNALTPRNVSYFKVHRLDFPDPTVADQIMEKYGSDGPDGFQLYRFPIIFPLDDLHAVMPHLLQCYTRSERKYFSEYDENGERMCMQKGEYQKNSDGTFQRTLGGRPTVVRCKCEPEKCQEFQQLQCKISGRFIFYIPGIVGMSAFSLATASYYSLSGAREKLAMLAQAQHGRISGVLNGKPFFYLSKTLEDLPSMDPATGKTVKRKQYIIDLEAQIDMTALYQNLENRPQLAHDSTAALALPNPIDPADDEGFLIAHDSIEQEQQPAPPPVPVETVESVRDEITRLRDLCPHLTQDDFYIFYDNRNARGWTNDLSKLTEIRDELVAATETPETLDAYENRIINTVQELEPEE